MLVYTRNALVSLRNSLKLMDRLSHGSLRRPLRPLSGELWQRLKFHNLLAPTRGQRGGNRSDMVIAVLESHINRCLKKRAEQNGANHSNLLNIQIDTSNVSDKKTTQALPEQTLGQRNQPESFQRSKIKMAHLNIRSLKNRNHLIQLQMLTREKAFDILAIAESWLNSTVTNAEIGIDGYKLF